MYMTKDQEKYDLRKSNEKMMENVHVVSPQTNEKRHFIERNVKKHQFFFFLFFFFLQVLQFLT